MQPKDAKNKSQFAPFMAGKEKSHPNPSPHRSHSLGMSDAPYRADFVGAAATKSPCALLAIRAQADASALEKKACIRASQRQFYSTPKSMAGGTTKPKRGSSSKPSRG
ncbi:MAG TPA: hypothetical protein VNU49_09755 [Opitutaceae bacterium]|nr:hypothetical protein [Opitutaceae bacterium]